MNTSKTITTIIVLISIVLNVTLSVKLIDSRNQLRESELNIGTYEAIVADCQRTIEDLRQSPVSIGLLPEDPEDIGTYADAPEVEEDEVF